MNPEAKQSAHSEQACFEQALQELKSKSANMILPREEDEKRSSRSNGRGRSKPVNNMLYIYHCLCGAILLSVQPELCFSGQASVRAAVISK